MEQIERKQHSILHINVKNTGYWLLLTFLTLPHMKPAYVQLFPNIDTLFDVLRGISILTIGFWYLIKRKPISLVVVLIALWRVFLLYSTIVHGGEVYSSIVESFSIVSVVLLYDTAYNSKKTIFISAQLFCFELMIYINLFTVLAYPNGLYVDPITHRWNQWFLGYYNTHTQYFVPAIMFAWLYIEKTGHKLRPLLLQIAIFATAFLVWSGGEIVLLLSMLLVYVFFKNRTRFFNYFTYWSLHIVFFIFVVLLKMQNLFKWLIDDFLGKWNSLTTRMDLWDRHIQHFFHSPIIGYGLQDGYSVRVPENGGLIYAIHAHNMVLEQLYQAGLIGLGLWVVIIVISGRKLMKYSDTQESKAISTAFLGWCVATLVEPYATPFLIGMFIIAYKSNRSENSLAGVEIEPADKYKGHAFRIRLR